MDSEGEEGEEQQRGKEVEVNKERKYKEMNVSPSVGTRTRAQTNIPNVPKVAIVGRGKKTPQRRGEWPPKGIGNNKIWIYWYEELEMLGVEIREQMVTIRVKAAIIEQEIHITAVYAKCSRSERVELWDQIKEYGERLQEGVVWSVIGDFSCILRVEKKKGGVAYDMAKTRDFQNCIDGVGLREMVFYGNPLTWWNGRQGDQAMWKKVR
nr:uncharacterized protein LOC109162265 [Ipomoea batatas]